jgi:hypothetical protein
MSQNPLHPLYGPYTPGWKVCAGFPDYEINEQSQVRRINTQNLLGSNHIVTLSKNGKKHSIRVYKLCLLTFFPNVIPKQTVDHIDECYTNHFVENLAYLSFAENTAKSNRLRKRSHAKVCKPILQQNLQSQTIAKFESSNAAEKATGIRSSNIRQACRLSGTSGGFLWTYADADWHKDLPGEVWVTNTKVKNMLQQGGMGEVIKVSNLGRIQTVTGIKTLGSKMSRNRKYRTYGSLPVHKLVWAAFGDRSPKKGEFILHNDQQPLDAEGCVSNAFAHLRLGTQSENMKECHDFGALSKKKSQKRTFSEMIN